MRGHSALVVHPDAELLRRSGESLSAAGFQVMVARSGREARQAVGDFSRFLPDVLVGPLEAVEAGGDGLLAHLRGHPPTARIPVVVLASGNGNERRDALRAGFHHLVLPPHDGEELVLATRLALDQRRDANLLSGSLDQLSVPELLQTAEAARRSGTVVFESRGRRATVWLRDGRVVDAETAAGTRGREAVYQVVAWEDGSFQAEFRAVSVPETISGSTSFLLLEGMRRLDEERRRTEAPPHAAMPDPPPPPPRRLRALHRALTLVTVAASYAGDHLAPELVGRRLEAARAALAGAHPPLAGFRVGTAGQPALVGELAGGGTEVDVEALVAAVAAWLRRFFADTEAALPGRFPLRRLRQITEAVSDDMAELGFYQALGLSSEDAR